MKPPEMLSTTHPSSLKVVLGSCATLIAGPSIDTWKAEYLYNLVEVLAVLLYTYSKVQCRK